MAELAPHSTLWRNADFLRLWSGQSVSQLGSQVSLIAIPLTAVAILHVSAFQAGLLGTAEYLPWLFLGLPAGVIVDRTSRRRILIVSDAGRAVALGSIPVAWWLGHLTLGQLYGVALAAGCLTVLFDVAYQSFLPALVSDRQLIDANSKLEVSSSTAGLAGPGLGGALVAAVGAAVAIVADAASYVVSVIFLLLVRARDAPATLAADALTLRALRTEVGEGWRYLVHHRLQWPIALCTATSNLFGDMAFVLVVLFAVRDLGMSSAAVGLAFSVGGVGLLLGALTAQRIGVRLGVGPAMVGSAGLFPLGIVLLAVAPASHPFWFVAGQGFLSGFNAAVYNVNGRSLRQAITPRRLLGRVTATTRFIIWGTIPIGTFLGGLLGSAIGLRATFVVAAVGISTSGLWIVFSPVRRVRTILEAVSYGESELADVESAAELALSEFPRG
jgi:MFS family permease